MSKLKLILFSEAKFISWSGKLKFFNARQKADGRDPKQTDKESRLSGVLPAGRTEPTQQQVQGQQQEEEPAYEPNKKNIINEKVKALWLTLNNKNPIKKQGIISPKTTNKGVNNLPSRVN